MELLTLDWGRREMICVVHGFPSKFHALQCASLRLERGCKAEKALIRGDLRQSSTRGSTRT